MGSNPSGRTRAATIAFASVAAGCSVVAVLGNDYGTLDGAVADAGAADDGTSRAEGGQDARQDTRSSLDSTVGPDTSVPMDGPVVEPDAPQVDAPRSQDAAVVTLYDGGAGPSPFFIGAGNGYVYWTDSALGAVKYVRVPQVGPLPPLPSVNLVATGGTPIAIVVSNGVAYWADETEMKVCSFDADAGVQIKASVLAGIGSPYGVAVPTTSAGVFYTTSSGTVAESSPTDQLITMSQYSSLGSIVIDSGYLYWVVPSGGAVQQAHVGSPVNLTTLAVNQDQPTGITVGGGQVYWVNHGDGTIWHTATPGDGGATPQLVNADSPGVSNIVYAYPYVYWTNDVSGTVSRCLAPDCAGGPVVLAEQQVRPFGIAVDSSYVYWTNEGNGSGAGVMAIHK